MELRHLRYFCMVAVERNFVRAAERLGMAQPPLSRQIHQLEAELGTALFIRGTRPLQMTEAGRVLYEQAVQVLDRIEDIRAGMAALTSAPKRDLAIGLSGSVSYGKLASALRRFRAARPDLDLRLEEMTALDQIAALRERRIDAGFGRLMVEDVAIAQRILQCDPLVVALGRDEPLAEGQGDVRLEALMAEPLIVYPRRPRPSFADHVLGLLRTQDLAPYAVVEARDLQAALGLVAAGEGVCMIPAPAASHRQDLAYRAIAESAAVSPVFMTMRAGEEDPDLADLLALYEVAA